MRILLIKPRWFIERDGYKYKHHVPPLNLAIIAALSGDHEVQIVDEDVENITYSPDWDLVGITAATFTSHAAYEISERFRSLGITTVLGGIHPSLMPEESLHHCDSVVVGEAEYVWEQLLTDLEAKELKRIYKSDRVTDMSEVPFPRRDLFPNSNVYFHDAIQVTRGCTNACYYCYLQSVPWGVFRKRPLEKVYDEIAHIKKKYFYIIDDNLFVDTDYVKQLCEKIAPLKKRWGIQAPTTIVQDDELLEKMAQGGCYLVALGFQSVSQTSLDAASIKQNKVKLYKEIVKKIHRYGMFVAGFFMFGFDTDDTTIFEATVRMIKEIDLDEPVFYILTPYPGTKLFAQLDREGRILRRDWSKYSWYNCNFSPRKMTPEELKGGLSGAYLELNSYYKRKIIPMFWKYKHWLFKDPRLTMYLCRNYFNFPDIKKLP